MQVEKLCKKCGVVKPADQFSVLKRPYKGVMNYYLQSACKNCMSMHSRFYVKHVRTTPRVYKSKKRLYSHETWNQMKSPVPWRVMKNMFDRVPSKIYPICAEGHRYVGDNCLLCKRNMLTLQNISS